MQFNKLYLSISVLLIGAIWVACVDIPSGPGTNPNTNFRTTVRFVHAIEGGAAGNISIDGATAGSSMSYLGNSGYLDVAAGGRSLSFGGSTPLSLNLNSEEQSTVVIYQADNATAYLNLREGYAAVNNGVPGFSRIKFVNVANGAAANVIFRKNSVGTGEHDSLAASAFGAATQYIQFDPDPSDTIFAISGGGYTSAISGATSGSTGSGTVDFSVANGLVVNATIKTKNSEGFFTSAGVYNSGGTLLYTIPVATQTMSFKTIAISGGQEVPPVTTTASGTAILTVTNSTAAADSGANYKITTTTPTSMGFFTAAHFHNAAAGVNGPVIQAINVTKQTMSFPATTANGLNEVPPVTNTSASGACTFTLWRDSLQYNIVLTKDQFDDTLTAAHFHLGAAGVNGPVVRTLMSTRFSGDTTLSGVWRRTDTTLGLLTDVLIASIRDGNVYFNAHSVSRPGGIVRAQLVPNATHTNVFDAAFTGATLTTAIRDEFAYSRMYINFHSSANPGGEIRGQAVPDTFTTSSFTATVTGLANEIGDSLNQGRFSIAFNTTLQPGGAIRGQLGVDATKGQYAVTSLSNTAFDAGRMYTLIATGKGSTFNILKLEDRLGGTAKPAVTPASNVVKKAQAKKDQATKE